MNTRQRLLDSFLYQDNRCIAAMQLVERGILVLEDADLVERYCFELKDGRIIKGIGKDGRAESECGKEEEDYVEDVVVSYWYTLQTIMHECEH